jgi:hypothetical protein
MARGFVIELDEGEEGSPEPWFKFNPTERDLGFMNMLRLVGNFPQDVHTEGAALVESMPQMPQAIANLSRAVQGSGEAASHALLGTRMTPNAELFLELMKTIPNEYLSAETAVERPARFMMNWSGVAPALRMLRGSQAAQTAQRGLRGLSPASTVPEAVRGVGQGVAKTVETMGPEVLSFTTGFEQQAFREAFRAGRAGGEAQRKFFSMLREKRPSFDIKQDAFAAIKSIENNRRQEYVAKLPGLKLKNPKAPIQLGKVKGDILRHLAKEYRVKITRKGNDLVYDFKNRDKPSRIGLAEEQKSVRELMDLIVWWTDNGIEGADLLKQWIGQRFPKIKDEAPRMHAIVTHAYEKIRKELGDKVSGYDDLMKPYEQASETLTEIRNVMSSESKNPEAFLNKLNSILREPANYDMRRGLADEMERISGIPLRAQAAGTALSQIPPKSLIARSAAMGYISQFDPRIFFLIPAASPRVVGETLGLLGMGARKVDGYSRAIRNMYRMLPEGMAVEGLTLGAILLRLSDIRNQPPEDLYAELFQGSRPPKKRRTGLGRLSKVQ